MVHCPILSFSGLSDIGLAAGKELAIRALEKLELEVQLTQAPFSRASARAVGLLRRALGRALGHSAGFGSALEFFLLL